MTSVRKPQTASNLIELDWRIGWIDPKGIIYPIEDEWHEKWIENNIDYLEDTYSGLDLYYTDPSNYSDVLARNGWIRIRENNGNRMSFSIYRILNRNSLNILEKLFFDVLDPEDRFWITIEDYSYKNVVFDWRSFIDSGMSFIDFVKESISVSYVNNLNWYN
jgi:hypothetical protein